MTPTDWQNILQCIDLAIRQTGLQNIGVLVPLATKVREEIAKLEQAPPAPTPAVLPQ